MPDYKRRILTRVTIHRMKTENKTREEIFKEYPNWTDEVKEELRKNIPMSFH